MANISLPRDNNRITVIGGTSSTDGISPVTIYVDPVTHRLKVDASSGSTSLVVGTTTITSGTNTYIEYNNNGVLGEYSLTGTGTVVVMATAPTISGHPTIEGVTSTGATGTGKFVFDTSPTFQTSINGAYLTASQILASDSSSNIVSLAVATYPNLTELSYVKGVTSAIQTQLGTKQATITFGTGVLTALGVNIGSAGAPVLFNGALGTPSSGTATNITGLPAASVLAGSLGTGAYVMDTKLTVPQIITTANAITASGNAATVPVTSKNNIVTNNSAATLTVTLTTTSAVNMQPVIVQILDATGAAQTLTLVNTENSTVTAPASTNGSTTLPLTLGFIFNSATTKWRLVAVA